MGPSAAVEIPFGYRFGSSELWSKGISVASFGPGTSGDGEWELLEVFFDFLHRMAWPLH